MEEDIQHKRGIGKNGKLEKILKFDIDLMEKEQPFISKNRRNRKKLNENG